MAINGFIAAVVMGIMASAVCLAKTSANDATSADEPFIRCIVVSEDGHVHDAPQKEGDVIGNWQIIWPAGYEKGDVRSRVWFGDVEHRLTHSEAGKTIERCSEALAKSDANDAEFRFDCLSIITMAHCMRREWAKADSVATMLTSHAESAHDSTLICSAHCAKAYIAASKGHAGEAERAMARALDYEPSIRDSVLLCLVKDMASCVYCAIGQHAVSLGFANDGLKVSFGLGNRWLRAKSLKCKGEALLHIGQMGLARECILESIHIYRNDGDSYRLACCYLTLGRIYLTGNQNSMAADCFSEAADLFRRHDDIPQYCDAMAGLYMTVEEGEKASRKEIEASHDEAASQYNESIDKRGDILLPTMAERLGEIKSNRYAKYALLGAGALALVMVCVAVISRMRRRHRQAGVRHSLRRILLLALRKIPFIGKQNEALTESDQMFLMRFSREVKKCMKSGHVDLKSVAQRMRQKEWQIQQRVLNVTGKTAESYIKSIRIGRARQLFDDAQSTTAKASAECGYSSAKDFAYDFSEIMGMTPEEYRRLRGLE